MAMAGKEVSRGVARLYPLHLSRWPCHRHLARMHHVSECSRGRKCSAMLMRVPSHASFHQDAPVSSKPLMAAATLATSLVLGMTPITPAAFAITPERRAELLAMA